MHRCGFKIPIARGIRTTSRTRLYIGTNTSARIGATTVGVNATCSAPDVGPTGPATSLHRVKAAKRTSCRQCTKTIPIRSDYFVY